LHKLIIMQTDTISLLDDLIRLTEANSQAVVRLKALDSKQLNFRQNNKSWSILECIEHLNLYGDFYLPEIEKQILAQLGSKKPGIFKSGVLGGYFANIMQVKNGKIKKMKSPKDKNPINSNLNITTIDRFLKQQELLKSLLNQAKNVDLVKTKTSISLTKLVKLRLGDTFRFFVYHIERHVKQADRLNEQIG
jgi:hypothetical protein